MNSIDRRERIEVYLVLAFVIITAGAALVLLA